jgi:hypothetical protein
MKLLPFLTTATITYARCDALAAWTASNQNQIYITAERPIPLQGWQGAGRNLVQPENWGYAFHLFKFLCCGSTAIHLV